MHIVIQSSQALGRHLGLRVATEETTGWPRRNKRQWNIELAEGKTGTAALFEAGEPMRDHMHILVVRDGRLFVDGVVTMLNPSHELADGISLTNPRFGGK